MRKRKYSLTLLEVIVALSLTGLLLAFLWQAYFSSQKQLASTQMKKMESLQKLLFQEKVSGLITGLVKKDSEKILYTTPSKISSYPMLVLNTCLPVDLDPDFSGPVLSALYLTDGNDLCLVNWADETKMRNEVLLKNVTACQFLFFDAKKKEWKDSWPQKEGRMPEMIKILISQKGVSDSYLFFPSQYLGPIIYPKKKSP